MKQYIGKRVLVTVGGNDAPQMTCVVALSPNGQYALLEDSHCLGQTFGWTALSDIKILDVLGDSSESASNLYSRLYSMHA